jgi:hypothetical protein
MDHDPAHVFTHDLAFSRVEACSDLEPQRLDATRYGQAQRIARAGPSKAAKKQSPAVLIARPRKRPISRRTRS